MTMKLSEVFGFICLPIAGAGYAAKALGIAHVDNSYFLATSMIPVAVIISNTGQWAFRRSSRKNRTMIPEINTP